MISDIYHTMRTHGMLPSPANFDNSSVIYIKDHLSYVAVVCCSGVLQWCAAVTCTYHTMRKHGMLPSPANFTLSEGVNACAAASIIPIGAAESVAPKNTYLCVSIYIYINAYV